MLQRSKISTMAYQIPAKPDFQFFLNRSTTSIQSSLAHAPFSQNSPMHVSHCWHFLKQQARKSLHLPKNCSLVTNSRPLQTLQWTPASPATSSTPANRWTFATGVARCCRCPPTSTRVALCSAPSAICRWRRAPSTAWAPSRGCTSTNGSWWRGSGRPSTPRDRWWSDCAPGVATTSSHLRRCRRAPPTRARLSSTPVSNAAPRRMKTPKALSEWVLACLPAFQLVNKFSFIYPLFIFYTVSYAHNQSAHQQRECRRNANKVCGIGKQVSKEKWLGKPGLFGYKACRESAEMCAARSANFAIRSTELSFTMAFTWLSNCGWKQN